MRAGAAFTTIMTALAVSAAFVCAAEGIPAVAPAKLNALIREGSAFWLVDVRGRAQFERSHIQGSMNVPVNELINSNFPRNKQYVLIDSSLGQKDARTALEALKAKGYAFVSILDGGLSRWQVEEYHTVDDGISEPISVTPQELAWAMENKIRLKVYDLRSPGSDSAKAIPGSERVDGNIIEERVARLRKMLGKGGSLMERLSAAPVVVLVVSIEDDPETVAGRVSAGVRMDIRYLSGGYEAYEFALKRAGMAARKQEAAPGQCIVK